MPLVEDKGTYVKLTAIEPYSLQPYQRAIRQVRETCQQNRRDKALADIRNVDQQIPVHG
jgi:hypothetical protein